MKANPEKVFDSNGELNEVAKGDIKVDPTKKTCKTPRGETIKHGEKYALHDIGSQDTPDMSATRSGDLGLFAQRIVFMEAREFGHFPGSEDVWRVDEQQPVIVEGRVAHIVKCVSNCIARRGEPDDG